MLKFTIYWIAGMKDMSLMILVEQDIHMFFNQLKKHKVSKNIMVNRAYINGQNIKCGHIIIHPPVQ